MDGDGEAVGEPGQALFDPVLAMLEGPPGIVVDAAQEGAAHTALHAMEGSGTAGGNERGARLGHAASIAAGRRGRCRELAGQRVGQI